MKIADLQKVLGRPAFHIILTLCFSVAFLWPIFALTRPTHTFHFLYLAWFLCLGALFAISRGREPRDLEGHGDLDGRSMPPSCPPASQEAR
jgi:hypothetical protein